MMKRPSMLTMPYGQAEPRTEVKVLVIGCSGVGKTLLLRHLKQKFPQKTESSKVSSPSSILSSILKFDTQPTTGTDVITIHQQNATITFREVGSTLVTKWPSYYAEANVIMYVIDSANMVQIPSSWIELLNLFNHKGVRDKSVLIVMNKSDISDQSSVARLKSIMRMDEILAKATCKRTSTVSVSALTGMNFDMLLKTIIKFGSEGKEGGSRKHK